MSTFFEVLSVVATVLGLAGTAYSLLLYFSSQQVRAYAVAMDFHLLRRDHEKLGEQLKALAREIESGFSEVNEKLTEVKIHLIYLRGEDGEHHS